MNVRSIKGWTDGVKGWFVDSPLILSDVVDKSPKVYTQLAREGVVLTQDSDNI